MYFFISAFLLFLFIWFLISYHGHLLIGIVEIGFDLPWGMGRLTACAFRIQILVFFSNMILDSLTKGIVWKENRTFLISRIIPFPIHKAVQQSVISQPFFFLTKIKHTMGSFFIPFFAEISEIFAFESRHLLFVYFIQVEYIRNKPRRLSVSRLSRVKITNWCLRIQLGKCTMKNCHKRVMSGPKKNEIPFY